MSEVKEKTCWACAFQNIATATLLGTCMWFEKNKKGDNKEIPADVVDKGCKHWSKKSTE